MEDVYAVGSADKVNFPDDLVFRYHFHFNIVILSFMSPLINRLRVVDNV